MDIHPVNNNNSTTPIPDLSTQPISELMGPTVYRDYHQMILSRSGYDSGRQTISDYQPVVCQCTDRIAVKNLESGAYVPLCPRHGTFRRENSNKHPHLHKRQEKFDSSRNAYQLNWWHVRVRTHKESLCRTTHHQNDQNQMDDEIMKE